MDGKRFDILAKAVADAVSRRSALKQVAAGASGAVLALVGVAQSDDLAEAKKSKRERRRERRKEKEKRRKKDKKKKKKERKNRECNSNGDCPQPGNPCQQAVCQDFKCRTENSQDGSGCGGGRVCQQGNCVETCGQTGAACETGATCCSEICTCEGGKPTNPEDGLCHGDSFFQGFESNKDGWYDWDDVGDNWPGTQNLIQRVPSGTDGIDANGGGFFAKVLPGQQANSLTATTLWGGYSSEFPQGGFNTSIDIYLDPAAASAGTHFDFSSAINGTNCLFLAESIFNVEINGAGDAVCVSAGSGVNTDACAGVTPVEIAVAGWYTFRHEFRIVGGDVEVTMRLFDGNDELENWDVAGPAGPAGGNRYGWFPFSDFPFLAIDNSERSQ